MTKDQVLAEALALEPADRESLAQDLLLSLSDADAESIGGAWLAEARRRDEAFARGDMISVTLDEAVERVLAKKVR